MDRTARFSALGLADFRYFWFGQIVSFSGTWMQTTAQGWLVYTLTESPFYLGLVGAMSSLPILLFTLLGGAVADRFRKRNILLLTQALSIVPALAIGVLLSLDLITVWHVVGFALFLGTVNAFDIPARQSFLLEMVGRGNLLSAIALNSAAFNGARILGPMAAGLLISHAGMEACFYINAASFLAVIAALRRIEKVGSPGVRGAGLVAEIMEGVRFIRGEAAVRRPMLLVAAFSLFAMPFVTLLPVFAVKGLGLGASGYGSLAAASGGGAFTAAILIAARGEFARKQRLMGAGAVLFPLALMGFARSGVYSLSLCLLAVAGFSLMSVLSMANGSVQLMTPDALRGRVMSVYTLTFLGMIPIGNFLMGVAADIMGTVAAVTAAAAACLAVAVALLPGAWRAE
jgi:MFS family permease